mgnify:CR=1 FL=1
MKNIKPQESPQTPPENTVIWGRETSFNTPSNRKDFLKENTVFYKGKTRNGNYVRNIPVSVDTTLLSKGEERYNIYCAACHTKTGNGLKSQITEKGWVIPNIREYPTTNKTDGELFTIVRHGIRSMPGYRKSLSEYESWAIVSHIRVLQKNNASALSELSENTKRKLR